LGLPRIPVLSKFQTLADDRVGVWYNWYVNKSRLLLMLSSNVFVAVGRAVITGWGGCRMKGRIQPVRDGQLLAGVGQLPALRIDGVNRMSPEAWPANYAKGAGRVDGELRGSAPVDCAAPVQGCRPQGSREDGDAVFFPRFEP